MEAGELLWAPSSERAASTLLRRFAVSVGRGDADYGSLHRWSIEDPGAFWAAVWEQCGLVGAPGSVAHRRGASMTDDRWFPEARLNLVDTMLAQDGAGDAIVGYDERGKRRVIAALEPLRR